MAGVRRGGLGGVGAHDGAGQRRISGRVLPRAGHRVRAQARGPADRGGRGRQDRGRHRRQRGIAGPPATSTGTPTPPCSPRTSTSRCWRRSRTASARRGRAARTRPTSGGRADAGSPYPGGGRRSRRLPVGIRELRRRACDDARRAGERRRRVAGALQASGIGPGDVVAVQLPGSYAGAVVQVAVGLCGAVLLPVVMIYGPREMDFVLRSSGASAVILAREHRGRPQADAILSGLSALPGLKFAVVVGDDAPGHGAVGYAELLRQPGGSYSRPRPDPDDRAVLMYTSGTTADPEGRAALAPDPAGRGNVPGLHPERPRRPASRALPARSHGGAAQPAADPAARHAHGDHGGVGRGAGGHPDRSPCGHLLRRARRCSLSGLLDQQAARDRDPRHSARVPDRRAPRCRRA